MDGLIVSNTTLSRPDTLKARDKSETGGLSGRPLLALSNHVLRRFREAAPTLPLIGAGGVESGEDAYAKIKAGANAVQLYSALVFEGPGMIKRLKRELAMLLRADGYASVEEACGVE